MKKTTHTILRWLQYTLIGAALLMTLFLALLHIASAIFDRHREMVEQFVSKAIDRPLTTKHVSLGSRGLEPIIKLHNLVVFDQNGTTKLISADRLDLGIDLIKSLFSWQIGFNFLSVRGGEISFVQDSSGRFRQVFPITSGKLNLSLINSKITHPLFRQPFLIKILKGVVSWKVEKDGLMVNVDSMKFADSWLEVMGRGSIRYPEGSPNPLVNIRLKYSLMNINKAKLYYPASLMPAHGLIWLDQAFIDSKKIFGEVVLEGDLAKFPFDNGEGKFTVDSKIKDIVLNYDSHWPRIEGITGSMIFDRRSMDIQSKHAKIMGSKVGHIRAIIADLNTPTLQIDGEINSDSKTGLLFVNSSPLKDTIGRNLKNISLLGSMLLKLKFTMPLSSNLKDQTTKIDGLIVLRDNQLMIKNWGLTAEHFGGNLIFTENSLQSKELSAMLFGHATPIAISTLNAGKKDSVTRIIVEGAVSLQDLEQSLRDDLQPYLEGGSGYKMVLDLSNTTPKNIFTISSGLVGVAVKLPAPFSKEPNQSMDSILSTHFHKGSDFKIFANYGDRCAIALKLGEDQWRSFLTGRGSATKLMLRELSLHIGKLRLFGKSLQKLTLDGWMKSDGLELTVATRDIKGELFFPKSSTEPLCGVFEKFHLDAADATELDSVTPERWPPLSLQINNFSYGNEHFDCLVLITTPVSNGLKIEELSIENHDFTIEGNGEWITQDGTHRSSLQGNFSAKNTGELLLKRHQIDNILGGSCIVDFNLHWPNMPHRPELKKSTGTLSIIANNGRIVSLDRRMETKLGLSRILNILSLQSLPRRLTLDFSDLSKQGLIFDTIVGNLELGGGNIAVKQLQLVGPAATMRASGRIGLIAEDYDLILGVSPKITSSLPIAATIAGGPVAGAIGFIADRIITDTMRHVDLYRCRITGSWSRPQVGSLTPDKF